MQEKKPTLEEVKKQLEERQEMFRKVRNGEFVLCPKCKKGTIHCNGEYCFYCDNKECNIIFSLDPAIPRDFMNK